MKCGKCGVEFEGGAFCPKCGTRIETEQNNTENKKMIYCPQCGKQIERDLKFCPYCGTRGVSNTEYGMESKSREKEVGSENTDIRKELVKSKPVKKKGWIISVSVVALIIILIVVGFSRFGLPDSLKEFEEEVSEKVPFLEKNTESDTLVKTNEDMEEVLEEDESVLQDKGNAAKEPDESSAETNVDYEEWVGEYVRDAGPCSNISIWSIDETGISFAVCIGNSGYLSYRDLRDCNAEWVDETLAAYDDGNGNRIEISLAADDMLTVVEERVDSQNALLISGAYKKTDNLNLNDYGFVIQDSDHRIITEDDLENLNPLECKIARNEIYARRGRLFADEQLQNYFDSCTWYRGEIAAEDFNLDMLNDIERENAEFISAYEDEMGYK